MAATGSMSKGVQDEEQESDEDVGGARGKSIWNGTVVNFYFTNFPLDWRKSDLWVVFAKIGKVVDVYVARKFNKEGKRFGFVRFANVENAVDFQFRLNQIWIRKFRLRVNIAKYGKSYTNLNPFPVNHFSSGARKDCNNANEINDSAESIELKVDGKVFVFKIPTSVIDHKIEFSFDLGCFKWKLVNNRCNRDVFYGSCELAGKSMAAGKQKGVVATEGVGDQRVTPVGSASRDSIAVSHAYEGGVDDSSKFENSSILEETQNKDATHDLYVPVFSAGSCDLAHDDGPVDNSIIGPRVFENNELDGKIFNGSIVIEKGDSKDVNSFKSVGLSEDHPLSRCQHKSKVKLKDKHHFFNFIQRKKSLIRKRHREEIKWYQRYTLNRLMEDVEGVDDDDDGSSSSESDS